MSTHKMGFYEDLTKIILQLSLNMHLISSGLTSCHEEQQRKIIIIIIIMTLFIEEAQLECSNLP